MHDDGISIGGSRPLANNLWDTTYARSLSRIIFGDYFGFLAARLALEDAELAF